MAKAINCINLWALRSQGTNYFFIVFFIELESSS